MSTCPRFELSGAIRRRWHFPLPKLALLNLFAVYVRVNQVLLTLPSDAQTESR
jgi:hypothetical protein